MPYKKHYALVALLMAVLCLIGCNSATTTPYIDETPAATTAVTTQPSPTAAPNQSWTLTILHTNDTMGQMIPSG